MRVSRGRKIFNFVMCVVLLVVALFPIYWLISLSVRDTAELSGHISVIPKTFTMEHFTKLFTEKNYSQILQNSLICTLVSLVFSLTFGLAAAYVLVRSRFSLKIKKPLTFWVLTLYDIRNCSPTATCVGALAVRVCATAVTATAIMSTNRNTVLFIFLPVLL